MSEYTAHPTQPGNTHELTSPGTLNYDITRSGSTRRWGTEPQMKSSGNGSNNTEQRRNPKIPCPEISGLLNWAIGLLGYWAIGILGYWCIGVLGYWAIGLLGYWAIGLLGYWAIGLLGYW